MNPHSVKLVCFSPTGTTKTIVQAMATGLGHRTIELLDITTPAARQEVLKTNENDLLIVAVPVYMGRVPSVLTAWIHAIEANNTPTVCVVVYGNRAYDDALLELKDMLEKQGCVPIAGASFIGEHSFSSVEFPSSAGRPDTKDLQLAANFGESIAVAISKLSSLEAATNLQVPGNYPYGGTKNLWHLDFIQVNDSCIQCGSCSDWCPVGAIDVTNSSNIDKDLCIFCCACIKRCLQHAKSMKPGPLKEAAIRCTKFIERNEPESVICAAFQFG